MNSNKKITVIVCTYTFDRLNDVDDVLTSIMKQSMKPDEIIICVDNNSELYNMLKAKNLGINSVFDLESNIGGRKYSDHRSQISIKIIENIGTAGLSETRNTGIKAATGDIIAFIDDDTVADINWLLNLTKNFDQSKNVKAVGGHTLPHWLNGDRPLWLPEELYWIVGCTYEGLLVNLDLIKNCENENFQARKVRNVPGCNMAFRKDFFEKAGFFRHDIGGLKHVPRGGEEAELCLRMKQSNPETLILYEPDAIIYHKVPQHRLSWKYIFLRSYNEGFYKAKVKRLHIKPINLNNTKTNALSTEMAYLRHLIFNAIPKRLLMSYKSEYALQTIAMAGCILATGLGYTIGRLRHIKLVKDRK